MKGEGSVVSVDRSSLLYDLSVVQISEISQLDSQNFYCVGKGSFSLDAGLAIPANDRKWFPTDSNSN